VSVELGGAVELAADVRELALLFFVENAEGVADAIGVRREGVADEVAAGGRQGDADRVRDAFGVLDEEEKRQLADICRKLDRAA
jgi:hypothetical protein